jgi:hypothetical protein
MLAIGAPIAGVFAAEPPCAMAQDADASPCDCDNSAASGCALACSSVSSAPVVLPALAAPLGSATADRVVDEPPAHFATLAGPPGLQPPR